MMKRKKQFLSIFSNIVIAVSLFATSAYATLQLPKPQSIAKIPSPEKFEKLPTPKRSTYVIDKIVAYVNHEIITQNELNIAIARAKKMIAQTGQIAPSEEVIHKQVLMQLIYQRLQLQMAKRANIKITKKQIDAAIVNLAKRRHLTIPKLMRTLRKHGYTNKTFRQEMKNEMMIGKLQQQILSKDVVVNDKDVTDFYKKYAQHQQQQVHYHLTDLVVALPESPNAKQLQATRSKANKIVQKLKNGAEFNQIMAAYPGVSVNNMGWQSGADLPQLFLTPLAAMKPGTFSAPIQAPNGFHIIKLYEKKGKVGGMPKKIKVQKFLFEHKFQQALQKWLKGLTKKAYIKISAV